MTSLASGGGGGGGGGGDMDITMEVMADTPPAPAPAPPSPLLSPGAVLQSMRGLMGRASSGHRGAEPKGAEPESCDGVPPPPSASPLSPPANMFHSMKEFVKNRRESLKERDSAPGPAHVPAPSPAPSPALQSVREFMWRRRDELAHTADRISDTVAAAAAGAGAGAEQAVHRVLHNIPGHRSHMETLSDGTNMVTLPLLL
jgi:hypothetical protein